MRRLGVALAALVLAAFAIGCGGDDDDDGGESDGASAAAEKWVGTFDSTFGQITFEADGEQVTGDYEYCGGHLEGEVSGNRLTGEWTEDPSACAPGQTRGDQTETSGTFDFTLSGDGNAFNGNWRYESGSKDPSGDDWAGARASGGSTDDSSSAS